MHPLPSSRSESLENVSCLLSIFLLETNKKKNEARIRLDYCHNPNKITYIPFFILSTGHKRFNRKIKIVSHFVFAMLYTFNSWVNYLLAICFIHDTFESLLGLNRKKKRIYEIFIFFIFTYCAFIQVLPQFVKLINEFANGMLKIVVPICLLN